MHKTLASVTVSPDPGPDNFEKDTDIFNVDHPRSVLNLLPKHMQIAIKKVSPHYFEKTEHELKLLLRPDPTTSRLRLAFWLEYDNAQANCRPMRMPLVYSGACHKSYFTKVICNDEEKLAWILTPPTDYMLAMRDVLQEGVEQFRKIVTAEIVDSHGNINHKAGELLVKIMQLADLKLFGSAVIRTQTETRALHVHTEVPTPAPEDIPETLEEVQKRIRAIQRTQGKENLAPPPVIDVTPEE